MIELKEYFLDELYEMGSGISTKPEQAGHGAPFVSFSSIYNNAILPEELPDLMDTSIEEQEKYSVKEGDIFLTRTSETLDELAMSSVAVKDYPNATFSGFAKRLRPIQKNITYAKFMAFFMRSNYFRKIINCKAVMTLRASFNEEIFSYIKIELPSYEHQVKCGDLFYAIEQKIRNNNKINAELETMAKTIYDYWFLQFEFPNEEGKPYKSSGGKMVWNEELKREIPDGWGTTTIKNITVCHDSKRIPLADNVRKERNGRYPYYGATGIMDYINDYIFDGDFILMAEDGSIMDEKGNPVLQRVHGKIWVNNHAHVLEPNKKYSCFLLLLLLKDISVMRIKTGSIQMKINQENMNKIVVPNIPENIIKQINQQLEIIDKKRISLEEENRELTAFRNFLLPLLMNGQVGFKDN